MREHNETSRRNFLKMIGLASAGILIKRLEAMADNSKSRPKVILDPGHGMGNKTKNIHDPGCVYVGYKESELVLDYAKRVGEILGDQGIDTNYTREDERTQTSLESRAQFANSVGADVFVSFHCNAFKDKQVRGVETYYFPKNEKGKELAQYIQENLIEKLEAKSCSPRNRGIKQNKDFRVLKDTEMPAVLIEAGFLSNEKDRRYLTEERDLIAQAIADGILRYFKE